MKKNMGKADSITRLLVAAILVVMYLMNIVSGTTAMVMLVVAGVFVLTSIVRVCPLYLPFGLSTRRKSSRL